MKLVLSINRKPGEEVPSAGNLRRHLYALLRHSLEKLEEHQHQPWMTATVEIDGRNRTAPTIAP